MSCDHSQKKNLYCKITRDKKLKIIHLRLTCSLDPLQQLFNHNFLLDTTQCIWLHNCISYDDSCRWRCSIYLDEATIWKGRLTLVEWYFPNPNSNEGKANKLQMRQAAKKHNILWCTRSRGCLHTQTRPFKPTAISKDSFFPKASSTGHVGELRSLQAT